MGRMSLSFGRINEPIFLRSIHSSGTLQVMEVSCRVVFRPCLPITKYSIIEARQALKTT